MHADFSEGTLPPLAMMGVTLDRYLPGRNAMLATKSYVIIQSNTNSRYKYNDLCFVLRIFRKR